MISRDGKDYPAIAHRISSMLLEKLKNTCDPCEVHICLNCGLVFCSNLCMNCGTFDILDHEVPYSFKLLVQELSIANKKVGLKYF